jgi:hypothetical protein
LEVRARTSLRKGEEIFIPYFDTEVPHAERQEKAINRGFTCQCGHCTLPAERSSVVDSNFKAFQEASDRLYNLRDIIVSRPVIDFGLMTSCTQTISTKIALYTHRPAVNLHFIFQYLDHSAAFGDALMFKMSARKLMNILKLSLGAVRSDMSAIVGARL